MDKNCGFDELLLLEEDIVKDLLRFYNKKLYFDKIIYTDWTARDVLAHIVTWHESFANNIVDIINGNELKLLKGKLYEINENGVKQLKDNSIEELKKKIIIAQKKIVKNIRNEKLELIPYRKNYKRKYTKEEHLEIVYKHIKGHYLVLSYLCQYFYLPKLILAQLLVMVNCCGVHQFRHFNKHIQVLKRLLQNTRL